VEPSESSLVRVRAVAGERVPDERGRAGSTDRRKENMSIWTILFVILFIAWVGGFTVFHVAGGLIHLLLVFAVISLIMHFVLGARTA